VEAGCDPARFWKITPIEASREMKAKAKARQNEQQQLTWLAWHIEAFARTKRLPTLKEVVGKGRRNQRQDPEILMANLKLAFGYDGDVKQ